MNIFHPNCWTKYPSMYKMQYLSLMLPGWTITKLTILHEIHSCLLWFIYSCVPWFMHQQNEKSMENKSFWCMKQWGNRIAFHMTNIPPILRLEPYIIFTRNLVTQQCTTIQSKQQWGLETSYRVVRIFMQLAQSAFRWCIIIY